MKSNLLSKGLAAAGHPAPPADGQRIAAPRARPRADEDATNGEPAALADPLDPATRHAAHLAPPILSPSFDVVTQAGATVQERSRVSIEDLLPALVRRIAWAGDRRKGSAVVELSGGRWAGTTVAVHAEDGRVRVELRGAHTGELGRRIAERLARRGIEVESVS